MHKAILVHWQWRLSNGEVIEDSKARNRPVLLRFDDDSLTDALKKSLVDMQPGEKRVIELQGQEVFGPHDPNRVQFMERQQFPQSVTLHEGLIVEFSMPDGNHLPGVIVRIVGDSVTVDFNPPWLDEVLTLSVECIGPAPTVTTDMPSIRVKIED